MDRSSEGPVIILLLGLSGAGKTFFISKAIKTDLDFRRTLDSVTSQVTSYSLREENPEIILYDTPGFGNTSKDDSDILGDIVDLLRDINQRNDRVSGVIFLHRITDNRITGSTKKTFEILRNLCGKDFFPHVALVTTMWTELDTSEAVRREEQLINHYWQEMTRKGALTLRFMGDTESALTIVTDLVRSRPKSRHVVPAIQREVLEEKISLLQSSAGRVIYEDIKQKLQNYDQSIARIREEHMELKQEIDCASSQRREEKEGELRQLKMEADRLVNERTRLHRILRKRSGEGPEWNTPKFSQDDHLLGQGTRSNLDPTVQQRRSHSEGRHGLEPDSANENSPEIVGSQSLNVRRKSFAGESLTITQLASPETNTRRPFGPRAISGELETNMATLHTYEEQRLPFQTVDPGNKSPEQYLGQENAEETAWTANRGRTLLQAVEEADEKTVWSLLENGADMNERVGGGITALHLACLKGYESIVQLLLSKGAVADVTTRAGKTPLHLAAENGHCGVAQLLLDQGADINARDALGEMPVQRAMQRDQKEMLKFLLDRGASVN